MAKDEDDARPQYQRIADALREAVKSGTYEPGDRLPSQSELADSYDVTRETVKRALEVLRDERHIVTRRGSGTFVRVATERPSGLRYHLEAAFEADTVKIDFFGFSSETLFSALAEPLDKVRHGQFAPSSIALRLIICDMTASLPVPAMADRQESEKDSDVRGRMALITDRSIQSILHTVSELADTTAEVRTLAAPPLLKVMLVNDEAWFGWYEVVRRSVGIRGEDLEIWDALGKDVTLFPVTSDDDDGAEWIGSARTWFESWWQVAREYGP